MPGSRPRDDVAGRPPTDPRVLLAVWLYAILEGVGSARAVDRLCRQHAAYRWLCGGAPVNHDLLAEFRRDNGARLDGLLTQSLTGLIAEKADLSGGAGDRRHQDPRPRRPRLAEPAPAVAPDRGGSSRARRGAEERAGQRSRRARAAADKARLAGGRGAGAAGRAAWQRLAELVQEKEARAKPHPQEEAQKGEPRVAVSDPEARLMRLADGTTAPAWNVRVATSNGFILGIDPIGAGTADWRRG
jgi:transposase-like protein DUF772